MTGIVNQFVKWRDELFRENNFAEFLDKIYNSDSDKSDLNTAYFVLYLVQIEKEKPELFKTIFYGEGFTFLAGDNKILNKDYIDDVKNNLALIRNKIKKLEETSLSDIFLAILVNKYKKSETLLNSLAELKNIKTDQVNIKIFLEVCATEPLKLLAKLEKKCPIDVVIEPHFLNNAKAIYDKVNQHEFLETISFFMKSFGNLEEVYKPHQKKGDPNSFVRNLGNTKETQVSNKLDEIRTSLTQ